VKKLTGGQEIGSSNLPVPTIFSLSFESGRPVVFRPARGARRDSARISPPRPFSLSLVAQPWHKIVPSVTVINCQSPHQRLTASPLKTLGSGPDSNRVLPLRSPDLPPHIVADYNEARDILQRSPRAASALIRLAIQKPCARESGENLNIRWAEEERQEFERQTSEPLEWPFNAKTV
jgi:hypothetical protein